MITYNRELLVPDGIVELHAADTKIITPAFHMPDGIWARRPGTITRRLPMIFGSAMHKTERAVTWASRPVYATTINPPDEIGFFFEDSHFSMVWDWLLPRLDEGWEGLDELLQR